MMKCSADVVTACDREGVCDCGMCLIDHHCVCPSDYGCGEE